MKKLQFFLLAAVAIVFAACSNDDVVLTDTGTSGTYAGGDGYISVSISMPTQTTTRVDAANGDKDDDETNNGIFLAGADAEYTIHDATLLLFSADPTKTDEADATLYAVYPLYLSTGTVVSDNIATEQSVVREIDLPEQVNGSDCNMYGLVVLNKGTLLSYSGEGTLASGDVSSIYFAGNPITGSTDITKLQAMIATADVSDFNSHGFFMTNAPLYTVAGGTSAPTGGEVLTLAPLNMDRIHATESDALSGDPALDVYVERAVAKVSVSDGHDTSGSLNQISSDNNLYGVTANILGYKLDVTNKQTYFVRNSCSTTTVAGGSKDYDWWDLCSLYKSQLATGLYLSDISNGYRFVGDSKVGSTAGTSMNGSTTEGSEDLYRTYWAKDPNYELNTTGSDANTITATTASNYFNVYTGEYIDDTDLSALTESTYDSSTTAYTYKDNNCEYCLENTFNVANQQQNQTTRVIVKVQFEVSDGTNNTTDLYTVNGVKSKVYTTNSVYETVDQQPQLKYEGIVNYLKDIVLDNDKVKEYKEAWTKADTDGAKEFDELLEVSMDVPTTGETPSSDILFKVTWGGTDQNGTWDTNTFNDDGKDDEEFQDALEGIVGTTATTGLNKTYTIAYYPEGKCYYAVRIMHFGNTLTPWESEEITHVYGTTADVYPAFGLGTDGETADGDWLGRYGVLRNNWYNVNVTGVAALGSAVVPELTDEYDDEIETDICCEVCILSWAKRTQQVDL